MKIFVTGASGWIGSATIRELLDSGHEVVGLARSEAAAEKVASLGADVLRGDLDDLDSLRTGAQACEGVVHLGYVHDFSRMADAANTDLAAIETFGAVLAGTGGPLVVASGTLGLNPGQVGTEDDSPPPGTHPRGLPTQKLRAEPCRPGRAVDGRALRADGARLGGETTHFIATLVSIARDKGVSGYVDDGSNRWPAVHRLDAARLVRLAVDDAPAGSVLHAIAEEGITSRAIAREAIGEGLRTARRVDPGREGHRPLWLDRHVLRRRRPGLERQDPASCCSGGRRRIPHCSRTCTRAPTTRDRADWLM